MKSKRTLPCIEERRVYNATYMSKVSKKEGKYLELNQVVSTAGRKVGLIKEGQAQGECP